MTTLTFRDRGYEVVTSSWSISTKSNSKLGIDIVYICGADGISFFQGATGTARCSLPFSFDEFIQLIKGNSFVDLRAIQLVRE